MRSVRSLLLIAAATASLAACSDSVSPHRMAPSRPQFDALNPPPAPVLLSATPLATLTTDGFVQILVTWQPYAPSGQYSVTGSLEGFVDGSTSNPAVVQFLYTDELAAGQKVVTCRNAASNVSLVLQASGFTVEPFTAPDSVVNASMAISQPSNAIATSCAVPVTAGAVHHGKSQK